MAGVGGALRVNPVTGVFICRPIIGIIPSRSFIRLLTETGICGGRRAPQFLAPLNGCQALAFVTGGIAIGLLAETFSVPIINPLHAIPDTETQLPAVSAQMEPGVLVDDVDGNAG